ncbi:MAG: prepilin-type N-terminal cleavage/methylation domain-containing protein [Ruminococcus sp.]|nr:prepilin-type N-terminal cleavage/methylation domain-containing protein [Ruminococcus sp.]
MNKNKTAMKGFTLIELIIVLAIFSVIMTLVMSFIDPVSRIMTKTSVRERTSAYVDNIGDYISKSIRHAQNIVVYEHDLYKDGVDAAFCTESELVMDFVDNYYDGGIDENLDPLKGKVHVLKLINNTVTDGSDTLEEGRIYESVYDFTAGMGKPETVYYDPSANTYYTEAEAATKSDAEKATYTELQRLNYNSSFPHSTVTIKTSNRPVINDEHFKDYSYYYKLGTATFDPITDPTVYSIEADTTGKYFYSRISDVTNTSGEALDSVSEYQFVVNVVSFTNDDKDADGNYDNKLSYMYTDADGKDQTVNIFKSPAAMSSVGMTFKNAQMQKESKAVKYHRKKLNSDGSVATEDGQPIIEPVTRNLGASPFKRVKDSYGNTDNIYIIFTVPTEIEDTEWKDVDSIEPPTTPGGMTL